MCVCHRLTSLYIEIYLMHWAHRIEDTTNTADVDYHLLHFSL